MVIFKVAAASRPAGVAGAIAKVIREQGHAEVQAIGVRAVHQATKAVIIARQYLEQDGLDIVFVPAFVELVIDGAERTAVKLSVESRSLAKETEDTAMPDLTKHFDVARGVC